MISACFVPFLVDLFMLLCKSTLNVYNNSDEPIPDFLLDLKLGGNCIFHSYILMTSYKLSLPEFYDISKIMTSIWCPYLQIDNLVCSQSCYTLGSLQHKQNMIPRIFLIRTMNHTHWFIHIIMRFFSVGPATRKRERMKKKVASPLT